MMRNSEAAGRFVRTQEEDGEENKNGGKYEDAFSKERSSRLIASQFQAIGRTVLPRPTSVYASSA